MNSRTETSRWIWLPVASALVLRLLIDHVLSSTGYRYGADPDTFYRTGLAWRWSSEPYFIPGHWVPLQLWLNGLSFLLLRPFLRGPTILVPVIWNHIFFSGSLAMTALFTWRLGGRAAVWAAMLLAATMTTDISTTYSGLAEPMLVFFFLLGGYAWWKAVAALPQFDAPSVVLLGGSAALASATHYIGWFLSVFAVSAMLWLAWQFRNTGPAGNPHYLRWIIGGVLLATTFQALWMTANYVEYGNAFRFLAKAQSYHTWFLVQSLSVRILATFRSVGTVEPIIPIIGGIGIFVAAKRNPSWVQYPAPALHYMALLTIAGVFALGVPDLRGRYVLAVDWLLVPYAAMLLITFLPSIRGFGKLAALFILVATTSADALRALDYRNWMDDATVELSRVLNQALSQRSPPGSILIEREPCLYPVGALETMVAKPELLSFAGSEEATFQAEFSPGAIRSHDLVVLTNPLTIESLQGSFHPTAEAGDYLVGVPSSKPPSPVPQAAPPTGWQAIDGTRILRRGSTGDFYFTFDQAPGAESIVAGVVTRVNVARDSCLVLSTQLQDRLGLDKYPWALLQQVVANGVVLWSHDMSAGRICGWQQIDEYVMSTTDDLTVELRVVARPGTGFPLDWTYAGLTGVRNLSLAPCG